MQKVYRPEVLATDVNRFVRPRRIVVALGVLTSLALAAFALVFADFRQARLVRMRA